RPPPFPYTPLFRSPPASNRRFSRRTCGTVIRRAAATWAFVSRPPHSAFNSPGRCSSFRLNVKVSIEGGPFHGAVRGGHFHVAASPTRIEHVETGKPIDAELHDLLTLDDVLEAAAKWMPTKIQIVRE